MFLTSLVTSISSAKLKPITLLPNISNIASHNFLLIYIFLICIVLPSTKVLSDQRNCRLLNLGYFRVFQTELAEIP